MASPHLSPPGTRRMSKQPLLQPPPPPSPGGSSQALDDDLDRQDLDDDDDDILLEIDSTFMREPTSDVKILAGRNVFWSHSVVLRFSSDFFRSIIEGDWAESQPSKESDSIIFPIPSSSSNRPAARPSFRPTSIVEGDRPTSSLSPSDFNSSPDNSGNAHLPPPANEWEDRGESVDLTLAEDLADRAKEVRVRRGTGRAYISITLPSNEAAPFHDFLHHVYPHLHLQVSWKNVEANVNFATKYQITTLIPLLTDFLLTHAPGRPLSALSIADDLSLRPLYLEASRYVLDNLPHWEEEEYLRLGGETRWKLERKRSWFLDRVLKMGLVEVGKDYVCHAACVTPALCARVLDEKFRAAYAASFRYGAPQPSVVFRNLRNLSVPPYGYVLPSTPCNEHAKQWVASLYDKMFEIPLSQTTEGNKARFFLFIKMSTD